MAPPRSAASSGTYRRTYSPEAQAFAHALGYDYGLTIGQAGLERERNDELSGVRNELTSIMD